MYGTPGSRLPAGRSFPRGTLLLFQQSTAPLGWTKQTTHNDKGLRVVSGAASSGGSVAFSTVFGQSATGATTLNSGQIPAHTHPQDPATLTTNIGAGGGIGCAASSNGGTTGSNGGGGGSHTHAMDIRVQYVDVIIGRKN